MLGLGIVLSVLTYFYRDLYDPAKNGECCHFIDDGELGLGLPLCFQGHSVIFVPVVQWKSLRTVAALI